MPIDITICNLALGMLREASIADINENNAQANACGLYYPHALSLMIEGPHDFSFLKRTASLALLLDNERDTEWAYAYALPADCSTPIRLLDDARGYDNWYEAQFIRKGYEIASGKLYTNTEDAVLEYITNDISGRVMPAMFRDGLAKTLAAYLAIPLRDSPERADVLMRSGELAKQRAITDDRNMQPNNDGYPADEVAIARIG